MTGDVPASQKPLSGVDTSVPHSARIWNYWQGGKDNYAIDREAGDQYRETFPGVVQMARSARLFLGRAVRFLAADAGIRQFLDVGTGLPANANTHEVAQSVSQDCRIVYVDNDPLVLAHARALLTSVSRDTVAYLDADVRDPANIVSRAAETLDFDRPIGLMLFGILGHLPDDDEVFSIVRHLVAALPSGSYLALYDGSDVNQQAVEAQEDYNDTGAVPYRFRSPELIAKFFDGLELVDPGLVPCPQWRPDGTNGPDENVTRCAVGRKP
ncbi:SAM-dependent methyltransferase [Saccharopolyspora sp. K220]|uniref:SAM-dependent methyltransferase n=1 Tax=Saccharopolyspora soli TaxID=2926618 RepID=UPI001F583E6D|nr:SAM-dependent methyltransferase [Saccharopolyspora soli]MCI2417487.1 SAM-dependent methyltransferase [Saccharopolyspora soli]